jgi:plastocyanin
MRLTRALLPIAALLPLAACGSTENSTSSGSGSGAASGSGPTVTAMDFSFSPTNVSLPSGGQVTVTFVNQGSTEHSLTLDDNSASMDADPGKTVTLSFSAPSSGTVSFHCKYHPTQMKGTFTVGGGGGAGAGGSGSSSSTSSSNGYGY